MLNLRYSGRGRHGENGLTGGGCAAKGRSGVGYTWLRYQISNQLSI